MSKVEEKSNYICVGLNENNDIIINISINGIITTLQIHATRAKILNKQLNALLSLEIFQEKN